MIPGTVPTRPVRNLSWMNLVPQTLLRFSFLSSIRAKMLMFAVVATLVPSLTTVWISYIENKRALTGKASEELQGVSAQAVRELDLWTKELRYDLRVFSSSYEVTENLERIPQQGGELAQSGIYHKRLTDYLNSVRDKFRDYTELLVLDTHGHLVATSSERPRQVALPTDWASDLRRNGWTQSAPYWSSKDEQATILVAVPIYSGALGRVSRTTPRVTGGPALGAFAARVNLRSAAAMLRRFAPGESGQIYVMTREGKIIISSRGASLSEERYKLESASWLLDRQDRAVQFTSFTDDRVVGSVRIVPALDWVVISEIPSAEAFRQVARLRNMTLTIVTFLLAVVGAFAYLLSLFIVRPLNRLTQAASRVAGGDLDIGLPVTGGGEVGYLTQVFNNMVVRLRESRVELERLSVTDPLTGLYNRLRMMEVLENEIRRSRRMRHPFSVLMADLDLFKKYNDAYGHPAGDAVLKRIGAIMRETSRDVDFVARYGGEEFLLMMPETRIDGAFEVAERIRKRIESAELSAGTITVSLGVAAFPAHGDEAEAVIAAADAALYKAKHAGGNRVIAAVRQRVSARKVPSE
ncbi:MAG TPA: diguanylate cyclase [Gemmatimonadales bacterium]|nr:diguanylate cyclase [Gemmatimonadales bacterium]